MTVVTGVFEALGDATRRRVLEVLAAGEQAAGDVVAAVQAHGPITQPGVSQHLRVLREAGLVTVRAEGTKRVYGLDAAGLDAARDWLAHLDPLAPVRAATGRPRHRGRPWPSRRTSYGLGRRGDQDV